jgi:hypothetical protein
MRDEEKQKSAFERARNEALARARATPEASPTISSTPSRSGRRSRDPPSEQPADELDANPTALPWLQTLVPAVEQREPELAHIKKTKN